MANYSLASCEKLIETYVNTYGGQATILVEGVLGLGKVLLHSAKGKKTAIIQEYFICSWMSGHSVRQYNKCPKKYEKYTQ